MSVMGFSVLLPAHDIAAGVVLSVNDVFLLVPGNGHALEFIPPYVDGKFAGILEFDAADIGYTFCG